jgi:hypothetical protein
MPPEVLLPGVTAILAFLFAMALLDQWRERRHVFQLVWAIGMLSFGAASAAESVAASAGWNETLYRLWYLTGAALTAGWLGLGTIYLLAKTRFGYTVAVVLFLSGLLTLVRQRPDDVESAVVPFLYFLVATVLALAIGVATYFQDERWARITAGGIVAGSLVAVVLVAAASIAPPGYALDARTGVPVSTLFPGELRLLTPILNITGGVCLGLGALFSTYVFMPKRRVLDYSLDPGQPGDAFLFNLVIAPVAILVNLVASLPAAVRALLGGRIHSRVPATILIALGAFIPSITDSLLRLGSTEAFQASKLVSVVLLFGGFLVSTEVFREIRIPFTSIRLRTARRERVATEER